MKFIADRIKFLKRKYENLKMIVQLLAFATKILQNMKAEVENYQIIRKAQWSQYKYQQINPFKLNMSNLSSNELISRNKSKSDPIYLERT